MSIYIKRIVFLMIFSVCIRGAWPQQGILDEIERNNLLLSALRGQAEAEKIGNRTGLNPENPEVEFHYLWGNGSENGNRTDWAVSQQFDFPSAYHYKRKVASGQNRQVELRYRIERKNLLLEAQNLCIRLIYQNALSEVLKEQLDLTAQISGLYKRRMEAGDASILEANRALYDQMDARKEYQAAEREREYLQSELVRLNGGLPIEVSDRKFPVLSVPDDFEGWYAGQRERNNFLQLAREETGLSRESEKLQRSLNLPKISAGYMSEKVLNEKFQGVTIGISVPLWENKNTVKRIKAQTIALQEQERDAAMQDYQRTKALYKKIEDLRQLLDEYKQLRDTDNTAVLLKKALDRGELSLIEFILELDIFYRLQQSMLETECDLHLASAELLQWNL